jgi:hypothetical protein
MSRGFHAMFDFNSFDFGERHFPYWPNQLYRIIDNKSAAEFKAASDIRFDICDDPDDGACKRILEDHLVWSPSQPLSPLLSASSSRNPIKVRCQHFSGARGLLV